MIYYVYSDELAHHGIKGQQWGVRRFQNPDGSLTEAGKKRYGTVDDKLKNIDKKKIAKTAKKVGAGVLLGSSAVAAISGLAGLASSARDPAISKALFEQTIKGGKDKPNISPAEKVIKMTQESLKAESNLADAVIRLQNRSNKKDEVDPAKLMSNTDLERAIERLSLEKRYKDLTSSDIDSGMAGVKDVLDIFGGLATIATGVVVSYATLKGLQKAANTVKG